MGLVLLLPLAVLAVLVATVVTALVPRGATPSADVETSPGAYLRARRHAALVAGLSWVALVLACLLLPEAVPFGADQGIVLACMPAIAGVVALLVAAVGERTWPRPAAPVRRASLARRTVRDVAPRTLAGLVLGWAAALLLVLVATALTADPGGRTVTFTPDAVSSSSAGPYPGTPYGVPLALATVVLLVATGTTLHLVAARPTVADVSTADDARLRRASARRVLAGVQLVVGGTLGGVLLVTGTALARASTTTWAVDDVWTTSTEPVAHALGVAAQLGAAGVLLVTCVVTGVALARASRETAPAPVPVAA
ncbi:hypothetical protein [Cellulomonas sp. S1-8]|uniref:hypothetical protein n=1 Tax=Cellulomonas sp. S1-8 TaxID=2904790 RepID=UPI002243CD41|nr:hypothetical protein [Cellulomonas sp. S1-8]UZN04682.1 hypothetical protein OKX07_07155 [Cellulomonas sp. S1-8]